MTEALSYRNQSIDFHSKSMEWFLYDKDLVIKELNNDLYLFKFNNKGPGRKFLQLFLSIYY